MSNTKTFLTLSLLILLGSMGASPGAGREVTRFEYTTPTPAAREGGKSEAGGAVFLTFSLLNEASDELQPQRFRSFSAPLKKVRLTTGWTAGYTPLTCSMVADGFGTRECRWKPNDDNDDNGTITIERICYWYGNECHQRHVRF